MDLIEETGSRAIDCGGLPNARTMDLMVPLMIELDRRSGAEAGSAREFCGAGWKSA